MLVCKPRNMNSSLQKLKRFETTISAWTEDSPMSESTGSRASYLLIGLGIGSALGIFFAPKSGKETRKYLVQKAEESKQYAQHKVRELREHAEDFVARGKKVAARQKESISGAIDAGRHAYQRAKSKAA